MAAGEGQEDPSLLSLRREARTIYGSDAPGYDAGGPDYPAEVYDILAARCGLVMARHGRRTPHRRDGNSTPFFQDGRIALWLA
jgi:hypothetical protein